jgi:hypothetical protein
MTQRDYTQLIAQLQQEYIERNPRTAQIERAAQRSLLNGANHMARHWNPFPFRYTEAHGAYVRDVDGGFELSDLDLIGDRVRRTPVVHPRATGPWVDLAAEAPTPRVFVAFMRFPAVFVSHLPNGDVVVRWNDIRFAPVGAASQADGSRPASHFGAWARFTAGRRLIAHGLGPG